MEALKGGIIVTAIFLLIIAITAGYNRNVGLVIGSFSGLMFLMIAEAVLKIREQGESILRISVGMILGGLVCFFVMPIPGIGLLFGPLLGGFVVALCAGFKAGWDLLPTTIVTALFVSAGMKIGHLHLIIGQILEFLGMSDAILNAVGTGAIFAILICCGVLWIYLVIFCGIGALVGALIHPSPALPKNLKPQAQELDKQYKKAKTMEEKAKIKEQAKELAKSARKSEEKRNLDIAKERWVKEGKSDLRKKAKKIKRRNGVTSEDLEKGLTAFLRDKVMPETKECAWNDNARKNWEEKMGISYPYSRTRWLWLVETDLMSEIQRIVKEWKEEKIGGDR